MTRAQCRFVLKCDTQFVISGVQFQSHVRTHDLSLDGYYQNFVLSSIKPPSDWLNIAIHKNVIHTCQVNKIKI